MSSSSDEPTAYDVFFTETAEVEVETAVLYYISLSSERAATWYSGLRAAADGLALFPHRFPYVPDRTRYDGVVRYRLYGKGTAAYRIIYRVIDPAPDESRGIVRILRVLHAMRNTPGFANDTASE